MNTRPDVSVVLVNYNTADYTAQCLNSLREAPPRANLEIVVVDNASADDGADRLVRDYPEIQLIRSPRNVGIAGGNNLGIRATAAPYVLLLNNDTLVLPKTIDQLVGFLEEHPTVAGAGGRLLNADRTFQSGDYGFPSLWREFLFVTHLGLLFNRHYPAHPPAAEMHEADWMSTAFALFRRAALEQVGLVDEDFFIYSDETDLFYRLKQAGWKVYHLPEVETIHFGGRSLTPWRRRRMLYRGKLLFFRKHYGTLRTVLLRMLFALCSMAKALGWTLVMLLPRLRERAKLERVSHIEIVRLCARLE